MAPVTAAQIAQANSMKRTAAVNALSQAAGIGVRTAATWMPADTVDPQFTYYAQANSSTCAAAATRMILKSISITRSEATIYSDLQAIGPVNPACTTIYLNDEQSEYDFSVATDSTKTVFKNNLYSCTCYE